MTLQVRKSAKKLVKRENERHAKKLLSLAIEKNECLEKIKNIVFFDLEKVTQTVEGWFVSNLVYELFEHFDSFYVRIVGCMRYESKDINRNPSYRWCRQIWDTDGVNSVKIERNLNLKNVALPTYSA